MQQSSKRAVGCTAAPRCISSWLCSSRFPWHWMSVLPAGAVAALRTNDAFELKQTHGLMGRRSPPRGGGQVGSGLKTLGSWVGGSPPGASPSQPRE